MESDNLNYKIVIIGGGPAGIATSLTLLARGVSHCIVEAKSEPSEKSGEAIPPNARPLLRQLGIEGLLENEPHSAYYGNKSCWGSAELIQEEFIQNLNGYGYLLNRQRFEGQLQSLVKTQGTAFYLGYRLDKIDKRPDGITLNIKNDDASKTIKCNYVIDATGRKASVCRRLGIETHAYDDQFALTFRVKLKTESPLQIFVEAVENGWWYAAPYGDRQMTLMFFTSRSLLPERDDTASFLAKAFRSSKHLPKALGISNLEPVLVKTIPAGTSSLDIPYGQNWLAVGDAAYAYDPISSYGITSALASGYYAGNALADHLAGQENALNTYRYIMEKAFQGYLEKLLHQYSVEKRWTNSPYWKNRLPVYAPA